MSENTFKFTVDLLREYCSASLANGEELAVEAFLLYEHGHVARAYFLAVAAIEESGKALLAFNGQGRNLADSAVTASLRRAMEDHSHKISAALTPMLSTCQATPESVANIFDLMVQLKRGREPSMYAEIRYAESTVQLPRSVVKDINAKDCIRLSADCLFNARNHVAEQRPRAWTRVEDQFFAMRSAPLEKLFTNEDFWWYYSAQCQAGNVDMAASVITYQREYQLKGKTFQHPISMVEKDDAPWLEKEE